jgi:hypothetical protein
LAAGPDRSSAKTRRGPYFVTPGAKRKQASGGEGWEMRGSIRLVLAAVLVGVLLQPLAVGGLAAQKQPAADLAVTDLGVAIVIGQKTTLSQGPLGPA